MIWSIVPPENLVNNPETSTSYEEIDCGGLKCLVEKTSPTECRVIRILTTNPNDYLRVELQPGSLLTYDPILKALS